MACLLAAIVECSVLRVSDPAFRKKARPGFSASKSHSRLGRFPTSTAMVGHAYSDKSGAAQRNMRKLREPIIMRVIKKSAVRAPTLRLSGK